VIADRPAPAQLEKAAPRRTARTVLVRTVVALLVVLGVCASSRVIWVATVPVGPEVRREQVTYLQRELADGAAERMQESFPEGFFFSHALTGLAAAGPARPGDAKALAAVRSALRAVQSPAGTARFLGQSRPENGVFWAGWSLLLAVEQARLSGLEADRQDVRDRATRILTALNADADGFLESYPGQSWPVDNMTAVAALARADALVSVPGVAAAVTAWPSRIAGVRDRATGLLPHKLGADGTVVEGPRGSSQALLLSFEPDVDPALAAQDYRRFVSTFVVRRIGLVGVREFPAGTKGDPDQDSGPLLLGVSASASAVALAAALRQRDGRLADGLNAEAELFGLPITWDGGRRYGLGTLPVGDAFLAWTRSQSASVSPAGSRPSPRPLWLLWGTLPLLPGALALALLIGARRRRHSGRGSSAPEPPLGAKPS
jgi:hypothetical protein